MSQDYIHGINKMKKPATKVMAPPGGQTNINIFGGGDEQPAVHNVRAGQAKRNTSNIFAAPEPEKPVAKAPVAAAAAPEPVTQQGPPAVKSDAPPVTAGSKGRPATKVMAPPGGKTSINLFG